MKINQKSLWLPAFALACLWLATSCTYYRGAQPKGYPDLHAFPSEMQGTFVADNNKIIIQNDRVIYYMDMTKSPMSATIGDTLHVRSLSPWTVLTTVGEFASGGKSYTVFALKMDEQNPNLLYGIQTDEDDIKAQFPNVAHTVEQHSVMTSNGKAEPPKDVTIFDPTPNELRQIIEAAFVKKRQEADYKAFVRQ
jgi:hypothetical protein